MRFNGGSARGMLGVGIPSTPFCRERVTVLAPITPHWPHGAVVVRHRNGKHCFVTATVDPPHVHNALIRATRKTSRTLSIGRLGVDVSSTNANRVPQAGLVGKDVQSNREANILLSHMLVPDMFKDRPLFCHQGMAIYNLIVSCVVTPWMSRQMSSMNRRAGG